MKGTILVVDDDSTTCEFLELTLRRGEYEVRSSASAERALEMLAEHDIDLIITDVNMPGMDGIELCERLVQVRPDVPAIVLTGAASLESAVSALRVGAYDYLTKPVDNKLLTVAVDRALQHRRLGQEIQRLQLALTSRQGPQGIVGNSASMKALFDIVARVADSDASVLISGESGTGKELIARAIHQASRRREGPFVAINCAAVPHALLESELFGHVRGAFTDAKSTRQGLFLEAHGGTLLLDEIGELPLDVQPKLLRALQERRVRAVGGSGEQSFDARIIAATNRDLEAEVEEKRFREDLYYRVNVVHVQVPPLRQRAGDVLLLAQHFLTQVSERGGKQINGLSESAAEKLLAYDWPGNVRELENCVEHAAALARFDQIMVDDLPEKVREYRPDRIVLSVEDPSDLVSLDELERRYVQRVLALVGGNKSRAAVILGLDRRTLYRRLERYATS